MKKKTGAKGKKSSIGDALLKVATGFSVEEVTEEYAEVDGQMRLTKRKETRKDIPPDLKAVQMLLSVEGDEYGGWSDEALQEEKERLLGLLQEAQIKQEKKTNQGGRVATKTKKASSATKKKTVKKKRQNFSLKTERKNTPCNGTLPLQGKNYMLYCFFCSSLIENQRDGSIR